MLMMLMGAVYLHNIPELVAQLGGDPAEVLATKPSFVVAALATLAAPGAIALATHGAQVLALKARAMLSGHQTNQSSAAHQPTAAAGAAATATATLGGTMVVARAAAKAAAAESAPDFVQVAYGYMPLVWGGTLAHYLKMFLLEGGMVLPAAARTFPFLGIDPSDLPQVIFFSIVCGLTGSFCLGNARMEEVAVHAP